MVTYCWQVLMESFLSQPHPGEAKGEPGSVMTQEQKEVLSHLAGSRKWLSPEPALPKPREPECDITVMSSPAGIGCFCKLPSSQPSVPLSLCAVLYPERHGRE